MLAQQEFNTHCFLRNERQNGGRQACISRSHSCALTTLSSERARDGPFEHDRDAFVITMTILPAVVRKFLYRRLGYTSWSPVEMTQSVQQYHIMLRIFHCNKSPLIQYPDDAWTHQMLRICHPDLCCLFVSYCPCQQDLFKKLWVDCRVWNPQSEAVSFGLAPVSETEVSERFRVGNARCGAATQHVDAFTPPDALQYSLHCTAAPHGTAFGVNEP